MANEKRLIDAKDMERQIKEALADTNPYGMGLMLRWVRVQPTVDAVEVVHGKWQERRFICMDSEVMLGYRCSECNLTFDAETNYCPNCGAKMDGDV